MSEEQFITWKQFMWAMKQFYKGLRKIAAAMQRLDKESYLRLNKQDRDDFESCTVEIAGKKYKFYKLKNTNATNVLT